MFDGKFERGSLPYVLKQIGDSGKSGELVCAHDSGKRSFVIDGRHIVGFQSNYPEDDLANFLFQQKVLTKEEYDVLISRALEGCDTEDLIIHSEIIEAELLRQQQAQRIESALVDTNNWRDGDYDFNDSPLVSFLEGTLQVPLVSCMLRLLRQEIPLDVVLERLGGERARLRPSFKLQELSAQIQLTPQEGFVLSRMTTAMAIRDILEIVPFPQSQVIPILHMLFVMGLVSHARAEEPAATLGPASTASTQPGHGIAADEGTPISAPSSTDRGDEALLLARIRVLLEEQQNSTFYGVLGVEETASVDEIKSAYHSLAKQYHPDRFSGDRVAPELREAIDELFEKIRAAYETVRDDKSRGDYDRARAGGRSTTGQPTQKEDPERVAEYSYQQGVQYYQRRDFFNAVQQFKEAVRFQPEVSKYRAGLAKAMMRNPRWRKEAEENMVKAIALDEFNADLRVDLGRLYLDAGLPRKAEAQFREALVWDAGNAKALKELSKMASEQQQKSLLSRLFGKRKKS